MLIKVFSVLSMLLKLNKFSPQCVGGGGGGGATGFLFSSKNGGGGGEDRLPALFCSYGNHSREDKCRNFQTIVELQ